MLIKKAMRNKVIISITSVILIIISCLNISVPVKAANTDIYKITYNANGGTGAIPVDNTSYAVGRNAIIHGRNGLEKQNHAFTGWNTDANGLGTTYLPNEMITVKGNIVLYAIWASSLPASTPITETTAPTPRPTPIAIQQPQPKNTPKPTPIPTPQPAPQSTPQPKQQQSSNTNPDKSITQKSDNTQTKKTAQSVTQPAQCQCSNAQEPTACQCTIQTGNYQNRYSTSDISAYTFKKTQACICSGGRFIYIVYNEFGVQIGTIYFIPDNISELIDNLNYLR